MGTRKLRYHVKRHKSKRIFKYSNRLDKGGKMNSEPKYKVLSTVTINGRKFELREYANHWSAVKHFANGSMEYVVNTFELAKGLYHAIQQPSKPCTYNSPLSK